jgi:hypothetical protein
MAETCAHFGLSRQRICQILDATGTPRNRRHDAAKAKSIRDKSIAKRILNGAAIEDVAVEFGLSIKAVRTIACDVGIVGCITKRKTKTAIARERASLRRNRAIARAYAKGTPVEQICAAHGLRYCRVLQIARTLGVGPRKNARRPYARGVRLLDIVAQLLTTKKTCSGIAADLGTHGSYVSQVYHDLSHRGVPMPIRKRFQKEAS